MDSSAEENNIVEELPLTLKAQAAGNEAVIEEDRITSIEQKKLGKSKTTVMFEDVASCELIEVDEGVNLLIKKHVGNQLVIGPLDADVAARAHALVMKLWKGE
ncbi:MAG: hypothetical protein ACLFS8_01205 [Clostridia bacterium]